MSKNKFFSKLRLHRRDRYKPTSLRPGARLVAPFFILGSDPRCLARRIFLRPGDRLPGRAIFPQVAISCPGPWPGFFLRVKRCLTGR